MHYEVVVKDRIKNTQEIIDSYGIEFTKYELKREVWKHICNVPDYLFEYLSDKDKLLKTVDSSYMISNLGRFGILNDDGQIELCMVYAYPDGYRKVRLLNQTYAVHRLVCIIFKYNKNPNKYKIIHHKTETTNNNRRWKLQWCDVSFNNKVGNAPKNNGLGVSRSFAFGNAKSPGIHSGTKGTSRKIKRKNIINGQIDTFDTIKDAAKNSNCVPRNVRESIYKIKDPFKCYTFEYDDNIGYRNRRETNGEPFVQLTYDHELVKIFYTLHEANINGFKCDKISECLRGECFAHKGYIWQTLKSYNEELLSKGLPIINLTLNVVKLTKNNQVIKYYTDPYEIIADGHRLNLVIRSCENGKVTKGFKWKYIND